MVHVFNSIDKVSGGVLKNSSDKGPSEKEIEDFPLSRSSSFLTSEKDDHISMEDKMAGCNVSFDHCT